MKKTWKIVLFTFLGIAVALLPVLQLVLNSRIISSQVDKFAVEYIDGDLDYSGMKFSLIKRFPKIIAEIDSLSITYPHDRFSAFDDPNAANMPLLKAGRGAEKDTLAAFDKLYITFNTWALLRGRVRVSKTELDNFRAYAHQYADGSANWNIFKFTTEIDTTETKPLALPWISVGELVIGDNPDIVYTNQRDTVFAGIRFNDFRAGTDFRLSHRDLRLRRTSLDLNALQVVGRVPGDTLALSLEHLFINEPETSHFDINLNGRSMVLTKKYGRMTIPYQLDASLVFDRLLQGVSLSIPHLDARVAYVPFHLDGDFEILKDSLVMDAHFAVEDCPVDTVLRNYADKFLDVSKDVSTTARLTVEIDAQGSLSKTSWPKADVCVSFPKAFVRYEPMDLDAYVALDVDAAMTPEKYVSADIHEFHASIPGASIDFDGNAKDLLGDNPSFKLSAKALANAVDLLRFVPESLGITDADGNLKVEIDASTNYNDLASLNFYKNEISGCIYTDSLRLRMPKDSIGAELFKTDIDITSGKEGLMFAGVFDSIYVNKGVALIARSRNMETNLKMYMAKLDEGSQPRVEFSTVNKRTFVKVASNKIGISSTSINAALQKHQPRGRAGMRRRSFLPKDVFADKDIDISLDSAKADFLRNWIPTFSVKADSGYVATTMFPIRTRLEGLSLNFGEDDVLSLDSLKVVAGTSDVSAKAKVRGLRRSLIRKRSMMTASVDVGSKNLNVNELIGAFNVGKDVLGDVKPQDEANESFVTDTLVDAVPEFPPLELIVVPANVNAELNAFIDKFEIFSAEIGPSKGRIKVQDRMVQIGDVDIRSEYGNVGLDAFYATRSKEDITLGLDLRLNEMSAKNIISLIPTVDSLVPALKTFNGKFKCDLSTTAKLDTSMNIIMPSLDGLLRITGHDLEITDAGEARKITKALMFRNKDIGHIDDLVVDAVVHDSKVEVFPFEIGVDRYRLALRGMQGFDRTMFYHVSVLKSPLPFKFGVNVFGSFDRWGFKLGKPQFQEGKVPFYTDKLDTVQVNIAKSIRNIYKNGIDEVVRYNEATMGMIQSASDIKNMTATVESQALSDEELSSIEKMGFEMTMQEQMDSARDEAELALKESMLDTSKLMTEYLREAYDSKTRRMMEKLLDKVKRKKNK